MTSYWAGEGRIAQSPISGGVEITAEQYAAALAGMLDGKVVTVEGGFAVIDPPQLEPDPEPDPEPVDLAAYAATKRWEKEVGGIEVGGMTIHTDDRSKSLIMGARLAASLDLEFATEWKTASGVFVTVDAGQVTAISDAVLAHVAHCFALEAAVLDAIASETITTPAEIDAAFA